MSKRLAASFRDPSGFLYEQDGVLYRQVNPFYQANYELLMRSGLYEALVRSGKMVPHQEVDVPEGSGAYLTLRPERLPFISYPYEWSFSQLKDAALLTLAIQKMALDHGMTLKDASAYNIQFHQGRPILIDTLSFDAYHEGRPWIAYRQFCQHFLAPLALMALRDARMGQMLRLYIDGIPLDLASTLLPGRTRFNFGLLTHLHLHASAQKRYAGDPGKVTRQSQETRVSKMGLIGLIDSLSGTVQGLSWKPQGTEWGEYYDATNYTPGAFEHKVQLVQQMLERAKPKQVWDLGANTGYFSRLASSQGIPTISADLDPAAVEKNYLTLREKQEHNLLPLVIDLTNPSPGLGWANTERSGLIERGPVDLVMALALVHHLTISNNVPLEDLSAFFAGLGRWLIVEFIPKEDSQVQRLLATREDIFPGYTREGFEQAFCRDFTLRESVSISGSHRILYLMEKKTS